MEPFYQDLTPTLSIEETSKIKHGNEKNLNNEENIPPLNQRSAKKVANVKQQNICEICQKSFSRNYYLKLHVKTVHKENENI